MNAAGGFAALVDDPSGTGKDPRMALLSLRAVFSMLCLWICSPEPEPEPEPTSEKDTDARLRVLVPECETAVFKLPTGFAVKPFWVASPEPFCVDGPERACVDSRWVRDATGTHLRPFPFPVGRSV